MGNLLQGKEIAKEIHKQTSKDIQEITEKLGTEPNIAIITAGETNALKDSEIKLHADLAVQLGIKVKKIILDENAQEDQLIQAIQLCNDDPSVQGILVLLPLPVHIDQEKVLSSISPNKELEGLNEEKDLNTLFNGRQISTISSLFTLLKSIEFDIFSSKNVLVIEEKILQENSVVRKLINLAEKLGITVEIVTTDNRNSKELCKHGDLLFISVDTPDLIDEQYVKEGSVVIDFNPICVGETFSQEKQAIVPVLKSGVNADSVLNKAKYLVPNLGGIGPIALATLMRNFVHNCHTLTEQAS